MSQEETIEILQELLKSVKTRGFKKTLNLLKTQSQAQVFLTDPLDKFIIETISDAFSIHEDDLLYSKYMRGENKYAIGLCVHYLYENKSLGEIHKRIFTNKNKTLLSKYRQIVYELNANYPEEKRILAIKLEIDRKIENFKKNNQ